ncbi:MAG: DUF4157 domain-containing protein [Acidimicrobiales bacterium]
MRTHDEADSIERTLVRARMVRGRAEPVRAEQAPLAEVAQPLSGVLGAARVIGLQRSIGNAAVAQLLRAGEEERSPVTDIVGKGGGRPLDAATRDRMEDSFGQDFSDVRVHTDAKAADSAASVGAKAYTVGADIVLGSAQANPASPTWQRTLAHELTHVVQQRSGPVDGSPAPGGIKLSDPSDRFEREAERVADRVMAGSAGLTESAGPGVDVAVQRVEEEDEDEGEEG